MIMALPLTTKKFIEKAQIVHENKYSYLDAEYIKSSIKVSITCSQHGNFNQTPNGHLRGQGCPVCTGNKKNTTKTFIEKAKHIHGNKYNYDKVKYINNSTKIVIYCHQHGEFTQIPNSHLHGLSITQNYKL